MCAVTSMPSSVTQLQNSPHTVNVLRLPNVYVLTLGLPPTYGVGLNRDRVSAYRLYIVLFSLVVCRMCIPCW